MALTLAQSTMLKIVKVAVNGITKSSKIASSPCIWRANNYSTEAAQDGDKEIQKSVFISQSNDIFTNLALEDWLYRNFDFTNHHILLMWRNSPCVVIGRHQNPWLEANTTNLLHQGMELARRNSGGGTVYHDNGNLNFTFFTPRAQYNRRNNLELITRALYREWGIETEISPREDIVVQGNYKQISGTAAKLGRPNSYHHCTLLVDVNKVNLSQSLRKENKGIVTNATASVPSPVMNLCEVSRNAKVELLLGAIGWEYLRTCPLTMEDGGQELISKQRGFQLINPTDEWFPGLNKLRNEFQSWEWRYGKTPKFQVKRSFKVPQEFLEENHVTEQELEICLDVNKGVIDDITLTIPPGLKSINGIHGEIRVMTSLRGRRFSEDAVITVENSLHDMRVREDEMQPVERKNQFVMNCMKQVMKSA